MNKKLYKILIFTCLNGWLLLLCCWMKRMTKHEHQTLGCFVEQKRNFWLWCYRQWSEWVCCSFVFFDILLNEFVCGWQKSFAIVFVSLSVVSVFGAKIVWCRNSHFSRKCVCVCVCCLALLVAHVKSIVRNQVEWTLSAIAGFQLNKNAFTLLNLLFRWSNCFVGFNFDGIGAAKKDVLLSK